jgi:hypothetical protein
MKRPKAARPWLARLAGRKPWVLALGLASALGLVLRLFAAARVGFGDSEALYASYAFHPAPAYLDHPGLIGLFARLVAGARGVAPSPVTAHRVTAVLATVSPLCVVWAARLLGADVRRALVAGLATLVVPEVSVGLFGMTPDLLLFAPWVLGLGLAGAALLADPSSVRAAACFVVAGVVAGVGLAAKASAAGLVLALVLTYLTRAARAHARTVWPWAGLALGALIVFPIADFEARTGWPMIHHRLVSTQGEAGVSLRNLGALVGGQLAYLSPVMAVAAALVARDLWRERRQDVVATLLANAFVVPLALLVPLCLWSRVAEPHWVAPALLALPLAYARRGTVLPRRLGAWAVGVAAAISVAIHAWVLFPSLAATLPSSLYDARLDLSNELYGWPAVIAAVRDLAAKHRLETPEPGDLVVLGPHWVICAQLEAALGPKVAVGCASKEAADFATWYPKERWEKANLLFFVTDARFPDDSRTRFPDRTRIDSRSLDLRRGGRVVRSFTIDVLAARAAASSPAMRLEKRHRDDAGVPEEGAVLVLPGVRRREELVPVEDGVGAGEHAEHLGLARERGATGG